MTTAGYTAFGNGTTISQRKQIPSNNEGIAISRISEKITVLISGRSSFNEKVEITSPVTIMLNVPTQPEASSRIFDATDGSGMEDMPNTIPNAIAIVIGVIIFFHDFGLLLKSEYPNV
jgi:hypothetical protein